MGLFGSLGKVFGTALKIGGGVAQFVPGVGGVVGKAAKIGGKVLSGGGQKPGVIAGMSAVMPGGAPAGAGANYVPVFQAMQNIRARTLPVAATTAAAPAPRKRKRRRTKARARTRTRKSGRRRYTRAQLAAGFGGKRRMRRR